MTELRGHVLTTLIFLGGVGFFILWTAATYFFGGIVIIMTMALPIAAIIYFVIFEHVMGR